MPRTTPTGASRPRKERAENAARRRRQMIEATLRSVARNGLAATTLATVSQEAGLSQGVAVFYFESKQRLLTEALRFHYENYRQTWQDRLKNASSVPVDRLIALVSADFDPVVFNPRSLAVWQAFWGQATARPIYAEIAEAFDAERAASVRDVCAGLLGDGAGRLEPETVATGIEALTDGLWVRAHLAPVWPSLPDVLEPVRVFLSALFPEHAERIRAGLDAQTIGPAEMSEPKQQE